ncbi:MAG: hypothetical protein RAO94_06790, partial [Candidatus Stygibacter australis]|nr:hypothetical protein [Candidatus Stygibacter australis]
MKKILTMIVVMFIFCGLLSGVAPEWEPITGAQYNMVLFNTVTIDEVNFTNEDGNMLAAFGPGGEEDCRAVASFFAGPDVWNMTIVSNLTGGEDISFKIYSAVFDWVFDCEESIPFEVDTTIGSLTEPYLLTATNEFNHQPEIVLPDVIVGNEDMEILRDFSDYVSDEDEEDELILSCEGSEHLTVGITGMLVSISPEANWNGTESLTFTVDDQMGGEAVDYVGVVIFPVNDPPEIDLPPLVGFNEDEGYELDISEMIWDVDGDELNILATGDNVSVDILDGIATFSSTPDWSGMENVTFFADDGVYREMTMAFVVVVVMPVNDAPVIVEFMPETTEIEFIEFGSVNFSILGEDIDSEISYVWLVNDIEAALGMDLHYEFDVVG